eukprot:NODE_31194_length_402_cov_0.836364.p4 GENE.NODE_31194_length_402_cov_0.836364~~NODE_31194_length_402_cov_0.836364.p4  ORF type:complete len:68 (-),score=3.97 NODE_31194_length_402_cov_0.836364:131-334(-)
MCIRVLFLCTLAAENSGTVASARRGVEGTHCQLVEQLQTSHEEELRRATAASRDEAAAAHGMSLIHI